jgi:hypothetical protein
MSSSARASHVNFEHPFTVEAWRSEFKPLDSLRFLDLERLSRGSHVIEVGTFEGGCCNKAARAHVHDGVVTEITVEPCKEQVEMTPGLSALVAEARKRLGGTEWHPVPLPEFAQNVGEIIITCTVCWHLCITWGRALYCIHCCSGPTAAWCTAGREPIIVGPL